MIDAAPANHLVHGTGPRWLRWPLVRMLIALVFVMLPFILLQVVLQKLPIDESVKKVWPELERAIGTVDGRAPVGDRVVRQLIRSIADPVQLGKTGETHFVLGDHWRSHFLREQAKKSEPFTVGNLRRWMNEPLAMGLPVEAQNLIILTFAGQTNRSFVKGNAPYPASIDQMADAEGVATAEIIRRALDDYLSDDVDATAALAATFGTDK